MSDWLDLNECRKLSIVFHAYVKRDPVLAPVFPASLHCQIEALAVFLAQLMGGPCLYSKQRWCLSLFEAHLRFRIGEMERAAWLRNMQKAMEEVGIREPVRAALQRFFHLSSAHLVNQPHAPQIGDGPPGEPGQRDLDRRWNMQRNLDEIVAAVRNHDAQRAIELAESGLARAYFELDRMALPSLLAIMSSSANGVLFEYVRRRLLSEPELVHERYTYDRVMLHEAAGGHNLRAVELMLQLGSDPDSRDRFGHTALYYAGNAVHLEGGGDVVRALVRGGADVNASERLKHCTALHMASRRGNIQVAEALLDCGADMEARDRAGDTALRRAVNCGKAAMTALLLARGADAHSIGSKGLTPAQAAKGTAMKRLFQNPGS